MHICGGTLKLQRMKCLHTVNRYTYRLLAKN